MTDLLSSLASEVPSRLETLRKTLERGVAAQSERERELVLAEALHLARNIENSVLVRACEHPKPRVRR